MRQPRLATEGRGLDACRHDPATGVANIGVQARAARGKRADELGTVPAHRAVGLQEDEEHVRAEDPRKVGSDRRRRREGPESRAAHLVGELARLPHVDDRRRFRDAEDVRNARVKALADGQQQRPGRKGCQQAPGPRIAGGIADTAERPPERRVDEQRKQHGTNDRGHHQPWICRGRQHRAHVGQESQIPIEVEAAPVQRPCGHVGIASDDQNDPEHRQPPQDRA